jgi:mono/diheme cytochrome c family protein
MSWEDKHSTMTWGVLPRMARLFQRHRGTEVANVTCRTCHGADAEEVAYKMPHGLPALDPKHLPDPRSSDTREGRIAKFMIDEVTPEMADAVGVAPRDATTGEGFGCFNCHPARP